MANIILAAIMLIVVFGSVGFIVYSLKKRPSGLKIILLGINITLVGGIIAVDPNSYLAGIEYLIVLSGLIISLIGLTKED